MGHTLLSVLPKTKAWNEVVDLLEAGGAPGNVVSAASSPRACTVGGFTGLRAMPNKTFNVRQVWIAASL